MRAGIAVLLSGLGASVLLRYLMISNIKESTITNKMMKSGHLVLKYNKNYRIIGTICFTISGICVLLTLTGIAPIKDIGDLIAFICLLLFFSLIGIYIIISIRNVKIEVFDDKIKYWNLFNRTKEISWDDIKKVECSKSREEIKLKTNIKSITVSTHMIGYLAFEVRMTRKLDKSIYEEALKKVIPF